jgi:ATP-dependent helicase/nuclease subunit B
MQAFLKTFAETLWKKHQPDLSRVCVVLPNRRGALFLKEYLATAAGKTIFAPEIYSTEDFIYKLSGQEIVDNTEMLFELYQVYTHTLGAEADSFELFSKWAPTLIADFNELDRYLIDAKQLFINLSSIREIENWSLNSTELTEFQQSYIHFWESLGVYYHTLRDKLQSENKSWQGLAYRYVSGHIEGLMKKQNWQTVCFVGFNALNAAEEKIFSHLLHTGQAELFWDADAYYLNDPGQEAGKFLRGYKHAFNADENQFRWISNDLLGTSKRIQVIGAPKNISQAKLAGTLLRDLQKNNQTLRSTALVLADENLLFPVLNSIPETITEINVTMGYPLKNTPMASLFLLLFQVHVNAEKFSKGRKGEKRFYHQDLSRLFRHPYIRQAFKESDILNFLCSYILDNNVVFIGFNQLEKKCRDQFADDWKQLRVLLLPWNSIADSFKALEETISILRTTFRNREKEMSNAHATSVETELLFQFHTFLKRLSTLCGKFGHVSELKTLQSLFSQLANSSTIPFYGEPLLGLQVMGMLETRTLDFENIILLSANENILPSGKAQNSFIPFDLKKLFGLPQYTDKDAVFSYHFYRLMQRAGNVYLLYNTESDKFGDGEKSRYVTQLLNELAKQNPQIEVTESLLELNYGSELEQAVSIEKDKQVLERLQVLAQRGLSPTLLNTYRKCPLRFYLHYVNGIREKEEVEEEIGADTMGTVMHEVLENLYQPFIGKALQIGDIEAMISGVEVQVKRSFANYFPEEVINTGKNLLAYRVSLKYLKTFLDTELSYLKKGGELHIAELEKEMSTMLSVNGQPVLIKGTADRVDRNRKGIRIIDYKTGRADDRELSVNDWSLLLQDSKLDKSFQLLSYAWLYVSENPNLGEPVLSGIITFRELSAGLKTVKAPIKNEMLEKESLDEFAAVLKTLISEMFDAGRPFIQTSDTKNCEFCPFKTFCRR